MLHKVYMLISPTKFAADKNAGTAAYTQYSKDLCFTVSVSPTGTALNVLWLKQYEAEATGRVFVCDMSWGTTGASACSLQLFGAGQGGKEVPEVVRVCPGVFFCNYDVQDLYFVEEVRSFDSDAHIAQLKQKKDVLAQEKRAALEEQRKKDEEELEKRRAEDFDSCDPRAANHNILPPGAKRARKGSMTGLQPQDADEDGANTTNEDHAE
jgi:hypothetical protein